MGGIQWKMGLMGRDRKETVRIRTKQKEWLRGYNAHIWLARACFISRSGLSGFFFNKIRKVREISPDPGVVDWKSSLLGQVQETMRTCMYNMHTKIPWH